MRHRKKNVGLNRTKAHRRALLANLASALFTHKKIRTTLPKAKAVRPYAERLITFAKKGDLAARREVLKKITQKPVVKELFEVVGPKYRDRDGGYTRIVRLDNREGDNAPMALLELVGFEPDDVPSAAPKQRRRRDRRAERKAAESKVKEDSKVEEAEEAVEEAPAETTEEKAEEAPVEEAKAEETEEAPAEEEAKEEAAEEKQEEAPEDKPEESEEGEKKE